jgi:4-amino-4-deoxy-L-arabinose transferase-like glycosyltransferase
VDIEQHFLLEPFVNLFVLLGALCWLRAPRGPTTRSALAAGAFIGAAALVKLTGGLALLALLASGPWRSALRQRAAAVGAAALTFAAVVVPFAALAGAGRMFDLIVSSQLQRPGGDTGGGSISGIAARLASTVRFGLAGLDPVGVAPRVVLFAAAVGILVWAWRRGGQHGRFWAALFAVELGAVIAAPDFYLQYAVPMAPPLAICAGAWLAAHAHRVADRRFVVAGAAAVLALGIAAAIRKGIVTPDRGGASFAALVDRHLGADACLFSDPPYLALAADRLLPRESDGSVLIDPFGALIAAALDDGSPPTTTAALTSTAAQRRLRSALSRCGAVALVYPPRAHPHMSAATAAWFVDRYAPVGRAAGHATLWVRRTQPGS